MNYEKQYYETDVVDETWVLVDGELRRIEGDDEDDDRDFSKSRFESESYEARRASSLNMMDLNDL